VVPNPLEEMRAIRYQDLVANPRDFCHALFRVSGLIGTHGITEDNLDERITTVMEVMKRDSQKGTSLSTSREANSDWSLSATELAIISDLFQRHPVIKTPDFILPHTLLH